ncbi:MAG: NADH-quinone oxidoreductase subunit N [Niabella sp.]
MNTLILSAILGVVMMFSGILFKRYDTVRTVGIVGMLLLFLVSCLELYGIRIIHYDASAFMEFNSYSMLFNSIAVGVTLLYLLVTARSMQSVGDYYAEYFALLFFILCGVVLTTSFTSLLTLFLGIEIISIPLYILTGADKKNLKSNEASLKYFLMGSFSTGVMLLGIALIYGAQGTFSLDKMHFDNNLQSHLQIAGMLILLFSLAFKASVAPFHFWTPDVYDGAPTVFTSFMATVVKVAVFVGFIRLFEGAFGVLQPTWQFWVAFMVALTLFVGNITAVFQQSVKRMLAYSSISHAGFMLLAVLAINDTAREGLLLYGTAYSLATIGVFAVLAKLSDVSYDGFNGLAKHEPLLALLVTIFLLSMAGIPLTAGFLAKFYMLKAVVLTGHNLWLVIFAVIMAAVSAYYYFRVIQAMYFKDGPSPHIETTMTEKISLIVIAVLTILFGIFPQILLNWLHFS